MAKRTKKHIIDKHALQSRPIGVLERIGDWLNSNKVVYLFPMSGALLVVAPFFFLMFGWIAYLLIKQRQVGVPNMPFFLPASSKVQFDPFNPDPAKKSDGSKKYRPATGIVYFGNEVHENLQCWFNSDTIRQHSSFLAATGSGKTFTMIGIFNVNSLIFGAGYMLVDGKADLDLAYKEISLLHRFNRLDDFFLVNYIQGDTNPWDEYQGHLTTNTFNILDTGTAASAIESFKSLMDGDGDIWAKRADALISGLLGPLVYLRDERIQFLNMGTMLDYLTVESAGLLCSPEPVPQFNNRVIPKIVNQQLYGFIKTLPGVSAKDFQTLLKGESVKNTQVYDQWGFCSMQIILVVNMLAGDYQNIFGCESGDINQDAIVLTDRVLLSLLPALEASPQSVAAMGRIILSSRKAMMGRSLGNQIEGEAKRNIETRPTNCNYPYINVMDEVGMYFDLSEGPASAQSRSLGFALAYLAQDLPAMKKLSEEVAKTVETVMANTIIKVAGRIIDKETRELYQDLAGEHWVWQKDRIEVSSTGMSTIAKDSSASYVKEKRLDDHELQELREGELFITAVQRLHRVDGPTMVPKKLEKLAINQFVPWQSYSVSKIIEYKLAKLQLKSIYHSATRDTDPVGYERLDDESLLTRDILERVKVCLPNVDSVQEAFMLGFSSCVVSDRELMSNVNQLVGQLDADAEANTHAEPESNQAALSSQEQQENNNQPGESKNDSVVTGGEDYAVDTAPDVPIDERNSEYEISDEEEAENDLYHVEEDLVTVEDEQVMTSSIEIEDEVGDASTTAKLEEYKASTIAEDKRSKFDSMFNAALVRNGTNKSKLTTSIAGINARFNHIKAVQEKFELGELSKDAAHKQLKEEPSEVTQQISHEKATVMMDKVESYTTYPTLPLPEANVKRTVQILSKVHSLLQSYRG
ncbi:TraM recognition domain-containing protein [Vibrio parahaemolyticus]|nr:TraM recognition domain-containing protein [Vibrio parahaemolyticus]